MLRALEDHHEPAAEHYRLDYNGYVTKRSGVNDATASPPAIYCSWARSSPFWNLVVPTLM